MSENDPGSRWEGLGDILRELEQGRTDDWYKSGSVVSIEEAAAIEHRLKELIDRQIIEENRGQSPTTKGLPPCQRIRKSRFG